MSKQKQSKLDSYAERLTEWFLPVDQGGKGFTLDQAREQLRLDGVSVSCSRLSVWWSGQQQVRLEDRLLSQIASGARQVREVEQQFGKAPAPELEMLVKLHRVLILKLATEGNVDAEKLELVNRMMREVQKFARLEQLGEQNKLEARKLELLEQRAKLADQAKGVMEDKGLSEVQRAARMREVFGIS